MKRVSANTLAELRADDTEMKICHLTGHGQAEGCGELFACVFDVFAGSFQSVFCFRFGVGARF